ncbi:MAG: hypothetical protein ABSA03_02110 [Streptosporangiaceae bacterium]
MSDTLNKRTDCVKAENSRGVCTISATSNGPRQDWLVCPYRALDDSLLSDMIRRLYEIPGYLPVLIRPVLALREASERAAILDAVHGDGGPRVFLYFQDKLGGEIGLSKTLASPELSFDITVVELPSADKNDMATPGSLRVGKYGVIELQTTDTHGSDTSAGCVLALPQPVWDSWQPFLGAPELHQQPDGTWRLLDDHDAHPSDWIYVFDIADQPDDTGPAPLEVRLVIGTDAQTLSRAAFDIGPAKAVEHGDAHDAVVSAIVRRLGSYLAGA